MSGTKCRARSVRVRNWGCRPGGSRSPSDRGAWLRRTIIAIRPTAIPGSADLALAHGIAATALYTLPQVRLPDQRADLGRNRVEFDRESFDLVLWGRIAAKRLEGVRGAFELSFFHLGERDSPRLASRDRSLDMASLRFVRQPGPGRFDFDGEMICRLRSISASLAPSAPKLGVSAGFVHLEAGYTFRHP